MILDLLFDDEARSRALAVRADRDPEQTLAEVAWNIVTEPGDGVAGALRGELGAVAALEYAFGGSGGAGERSAQLEAGRRRWEPRADPALVTEALTTALRIGAELVLPGDGTWPTSFDDLGAHAPGALWCRGSTEALSAATRSVSIVGARAASSYGEHVARELAGDLASDRYVVVSGGAYGIDGAAHRATLGIGGTTVAFVAGGVDRSYPAGHAQLFTRILDSGAVISEVPFGVPPTKWRFLARNRLIGALGLATVVVEAGWRSGSLNTAAHAASLGRPVGAVPGPITSPASAGCHRLLREFGAQCVTSAVEVRELVGQETSADARAGVDEADRTRLSDALSARSSRSPLDIARRSGLSRERVETLLGLFALEGLATRHEDGWRWKG